MPVELLLSTTQYQPRKPAPEQVLWVTAHRKQTSRGCIGEPRMSLERKLEDSFGANWSGWTTEGFSSGRTGWIPFTNFWKWCFFKFNLKTWNMQLLLSLQIKTFESSFSFRWCLNKKVCEYKRLVGKDVNQNWHICINCYKNSENNENPLTRGLSFRLKKGIWIIFISRFSVLTVVWWIRIISGSINV